MISCRPSKRIPSSTATAPIVEEIAPATLFHWASSHLLTSLSNFHAVDIPLHPPRDVLGAVWFPLLCYQYSPLPCSIISFYALGISHLLFSLLSRSCRTYGFSYTIFSWFCTASLWNLRATPLTTGYTCCPWIFHTLGYVGNFWASCGSLVIHLSSRKLDSPCHLWCILLLFRTQAGCIPLLTVKLDPGLFARRLWRFSPPRRLFNDMCVPMLYFSWNFWTHWNCFRAGLAGSYKPFLMPFIRRVWSSVDDGAQ